MFTWLKLFARSRVERTLLLDPDEFDALLVRERSRADRGRSCFSVLTLDIPAKELESSDLESIAGIFQQRRRATDLTGQTHDGHIAIALPDTNQKQAEVLAASLRESLSDKGFAFSHTVQVYPETQAT